MTSWAALNAGEHDVSRAGALGRATEEAQDANNTSLYEQALRFQQQKQVRVTTAWCANQCDVGFLTVVCALLLIGSRCTRDLLGAH